MPSTPGVYQYFNSDGKIIYVGKAKNLKRRVSSYFNKVHDSAKTNILVSNIADIKYICVNTEADALLLENNLIKKYQPRYKSCRFFCSCTCKGSRTAFQNQCKRSLQ